MSTTQILSAKTQHFIIDMDCINNSLANALIAQLGGEEEFLSNYEEISYTGVSGFDGFFSKKDAIEFFNKNESDIRLAVNCIATENGFDSIFEYINHYRLEALGGFSDGISSDDVAKAMHEPQMSTEESSVARIQFCSWMINASISYMCEQYANYSEEVSDING